MKASNERKVTLSWKELAEILRESGRIVEEEEIVGIALKNPKQLLLYFKKTT